MLVVAGVLAAMFAFAQDAEIVKVRGKGVGTDKTENRLHSGRLSRPVSAHKAEYAMLGHREIETAEDLFITKALAQVFNTQNVHITNPLFRKQDRGWVL